MDEFVRLRRNPPTLVVKKDAKDLVIKVVSVMCDNRYTFRLKKDEYGDFKLNTGRSAFSNFQMKHDKFDIEWEADDQNWDTVIEMINSGTSVIEKIMSR